MDIWISYFEADRVKKTEKKNRRMAHPVAGTSHLEKQHININVCMCLHMCMLVIASGQMFKSKRLDVLFCVDDVNY